MRIASKVDKSQPAIVRALRAVGAEVQHLHMVGDGCADLLVGFRGAWYVAEIKTLGYRWTLTDDEQQWHARFERVAPVHIWESEEQALKAIGAIA